MKRGGNSSFEHIVEDFRTKNDFDSFQVQEIFSYGSRVVPDLEKILREALESSEQIDLKIPPENMGWFAPAHALFLVAHLRSEKSLHLVLEFLSQKQKNLNYWLHDLLNDDIWEVVYLLGGNQLDRLQGFVLHKQHDCLARLAVCTALVQIALSFESKRPMIAKIFVKLLKMENDDPEFVGLLVSELMDLKDKALRPLMLKALGKKQIWPGIISAEEVNSGFKNNNVRKRKPLDLLQRFDYLRQYITDRSSRTFPQKSQKRVLENSL